MTYKKSRWGKGEGGRAATDNPFKRYFKVIVPHNIWHKIRPNDVVSICFNVIHYFHVVMFIEWPEM